MLCFVQLVHLINDIFGAAAKFFIKIDLYPMPCFAVVKIAERNFTAKHIFKAKCLRRELQNVAVVLFRLAALVFMLAIRLEVGYTIP